MEHEETDIPDEAAAVLACWHPRIRELLGDSLRGARLFGSIPLGGFEPRWSDIDVCAMLAEPVTGEQVEAIGRLHEELEARFLRGSGGAWRSTQFLEVLYVPEELASRPGSAARCLLAGTGERVVKVCDPVPGFERYMLADHSVVVIGEPAPFVPDTRAAMARQQSWLPRLLARPADDHSSIMLAGLLQELARTIVFFRDDRFLSKTAALEEEIAAGSPMADAYRIAVEVRRAGSARAEEHRAALVAAYERAAVSAGPLLTDLLSEV